MNKKIVGWLWNFSNKKEEYEEDFNELLQEWKTRKEKIEKIYHPANNEETKRISMDFNSLYLQKKMVDSTEGLKIATWVLALATIAFTISTIWGTDTANEAVSIALKIFLYLLVAGVAVGIGKLIINFIKKILRYFISKQKHAWCVKCGRIISEFEDDLNLPAFTTCPNCLNKKKKI